MFNKILSVLVIFLILAASAVIVLRIFFEDEFNVYIWDRFFVEQDHVSGFVDTLSIVGLYETQNLDVDTLDPFVRFPVSYIYEGLVLLDDDLGVRPSLALSWGEIEKNKWQFNLRKGVKFHDGSSFDADDVLASFEKARVEGSDLRKLLSSVVDVKKKDQYTLIFELNSEDPLFLVKMSYLMIISSKDSDKPVGTGKFVFIDSEKGVLNLQGFGDYWGGKVNVKNLKMLYEPDSTQRLQMLENGDVDIAASIPSSAMNSLHPDRFTTVSLPRLQMFFLVFNSSSEKFNNSFLKNAILLAVDREGLLEVLEDAALPLYQFSPRGVLGVNPNIVPKKNDLYEASQIINEYSPEDDIELILHVSAGSAAIADYLDSELRNIAIILDVKELEWDEMEKSLKNSDADMYILSWKFDVPDISEFIKVFVHSYSDGRNEFGSLNGKNYRNDEVDALIEKSLSESNFSDRSKELQDLMKIIVENDPFGVPLLELRSVYAYKKKLNIELNLDGSIDLSNVTANKK